MKCNGKKLTQNSNFVRNDDNVFNKFTTAIIAELYNQYPELLSQNQINVVQLSAAIFAKLFQQNPDLLGDNTSCNDLEYS